MKINVESEKAQTNYYFFIKYHSTNNEREMKTKQAA